VFCPQCGQSIPDQSKYCFGCGASVQDAASFLRNAPLSEAPRGVSETAMRTQEPSGPARAQSAPQKNKRNARLGALGSVVLLIAGAVAYGIWASNARAQVEAERRRAADDQRRVEAQRRKDEQVRLWNETERKIQTMLSYADSIVQTTQGRISHREEKPTDAIWVPRFLGDVDPRPATVTVGTVRFLRSPYPSMLEVKKNLGEDCECKDWKYNGEVSEEWCGWSVERPNGRKVTVTVTVYPKWDSGRDHNVQKIVILKERLSATSDDHADRTDYGYDEEEIQRSPSLWRSNTRH